MIFVFASSLKCHCHHTHQIVLFGVLYPNCTITPSFLQSLEPPVLLAREPQDLAARIKVLITDYILIFSINLF